MDVAPDGNAYMTNDRNMMRDEESFPGPDKFDPDRHAIRKDRDAHDSVAPVFGFGRR